MDLFLLLRLRMEFWQAQRLWLLRFQLMLTTGGSLVISVVCPLQVQCNLNGSLELLVGSWALSPFSWWKMLQTIWQCFWVCRLWGNRRKEWGREGISGWEWVGEGGSEGGGEQECITGLLGEWVGGGGGRRGRMSGGRRDLVRETVSKGGEGENEGRREGGIGWERRIGWGVCSEIRRGVDGVSPDVHACVSSQSLPVRAFNLQIVSGWMEYPGLWLLHSTQHDSETPSQDQCHFLYLWDIGQVLSPVLILFPLYY